MSRAEGIDDEVLDEGCYYLSKLDLSPKEIAERFEMPTSEVARRKRAFERRLKTGGAVESSDGLAFWKSIKEEAEGNIKVTFVSKNGFHHAWRSDLERFDGPTLLSIFEDCKRFLDMDPSARFLEYAPPKNYDPLAMQREINKALVVIESLLKNKWEEEEGRSGASRKRGADPAMR